MRLALAVLLASSLLLAPSPAGARRSRHKNCLYGWNSREKRCFSSADEAASARSGYKGFDEEPTVKPSKAKKKAAGSKKKQKPAAEAGE